MIPQIEEKDGRICGANLENQNGKSVLFFLQKAAKNNIPV